MAYDGLLLVDGVELINLSRTAQLAEVMGIDTLWTTPEDVAWIQTARGGVDYDLVESAPWYDPGHPASTEFAGIVPLSLSGLDDSTTEASTIEYITNGGTSGKPRNRTLPIVANVSVIASTTRGADFGKRWLDRTLRGSTDPLRCSGSDLHYFQYEQDDSLPVPPLAHRRNVTVSRGTSVTRKRHSHCSATWLVTFTWTANDPFEYGEPIEQFVNLGGVEPIGPVLDYGVAEHVVEQACPIYDYSPIYDPLRPALVASPTAPDFYPEGWTFLPGVTHKRDWVYLNPVEPSGLSVVPVVTLTTDFEARNVRVSVWPGDSGTNEYCNPLWTATVSYIPPGLDMVLDGEQEVAYVWDGASPVVRRADSLVYGENARPMRWRAFNDPNGLLVTLDIMDGDYDGDGTVRAALSFVPKSD